MALRKTNRLKKRKSIENVFLSGKSYNDFPLRFVWREYQDSNFFFKSTISLSKKRINKAVDRNYIKRIVSENIRLNLAQFNEIIEKKGISLDLIIVYLSNNSTDFSTVHTKVKSFIEKLKIFT